MKIENNICRRCGQLKSIDSFHINRARIKGINNFCKGCESLRKKKEYARNTNRSVDEIQKINVLIKQRSKIIDGKKYCNRCKQFKLVKYFSKGSYTTSGLFAHCKKCYSFYNRVTYNIQRMEFIIAYGGKCSCCGEKEIDLLTIEHIRNKGHKLLYSDNNRYLFNELKKLNWPEGYTVLCWNCNMSTAHGRPCVHSNERKIYDEKFEEFLLTDKRKEKYTKLVSKLKNR